MPEFITLSCPSCGSKLQIGNKLERFACAYCGNEHIVKRDGGTVSLASVSEHLENIKIGVDKTASELAIQRLKKELQTISDELWNFISAEIFEETPSLFNIIIGNYKYVAPRFHSTWERLTAKLQGKKRTIIDGDRAIAEAIWKMSSQEIQQTIDFLPESNLWKGNDLDRARTFGKKLLDYAVKIENLKKEIRKHQDIVNN